MLGAIAIQACMLAAWQTLQAYWVEEEVKQVKEVVLLLALPNFAAVDQCMQLHVHLLKMLTRSLRRVGC